MLPLGPSSAVPAHAHPWPGQIILGSQGGGVFCLLHCRKASPLEELRWCNQGQGLVKEASWWIRLLRGVSQGRKVWEEVPTGTNSWGGGPR